MFISSYWADDTEHAEKQWRDAGVDFDEKIILTVIITKFCDSADNMDEIEHFSSSFLEKAFKDGSLEL